MSVRCEIQPQFYRSSSSPFKSWWAESECCEWEWVTCNSTIGHVIQLSLNNLRDLDLDYYVFNKGVDWFLNVTLFGTIQELKSLNLFFIAIGGWIENEGFLFIYFFLEIVKWKYVNFVSYYIYLFLILFSIDLKKWLYTELVL